MGYFGWTPSMTDGVPMQPRYQGRIDLDRALPAVSDVLSRWWVMLSWPNAQPYSGGVLDAWPNRIAEGLVICRQEWAAVQAAVTQEAKEAHHG